jgi:two-component system sensor histidine kinase AlgZ
MSWNALWQSMSLDWAGFAITPSLKSMLFGLGVVLYAMVVVANYLAIEFRRARLAETRELESKVMAQEAELRMLRTQIDPHFLFNSLNSISALTSLDPPGARQMTLQLADFFRLSLGLEAHTMVTLEAESRLVAHFLAIEQVRFGARLAVQQTLEDNALACLLPPMILQPLVENAVKHGIGNLPDGGTVRIAARRAGSQLHITVDNDADADTPDRPGNGIGLANVRQRLATAYGHEAHIHWARTEHHFRVELTLPAHSKEA